MFLIVHDCNYNNFFRGKVMRPGYRKKIFAYNFSLKSKLYTQFYNYSLSKLVVDVYDRSSQ